MAKLEKPEKSEPTVTAAGGYPSAVKRMIAYQVERRMLKQRITRAELAVRLGTSRAAVNRLLDPENQSVTLQTLERAAEILECRLQVMFVEQ